MEIKPGKYRCRDGRQAVVLEVFEGKAFGRALNHSLNFWEEFSWCLDGSYFPDATTPSGYDLITSWEEPKPRLRAYINPNGVLYLLSDVEAMALGYDPVPELDALFEKGKE